MPAITIFDSQDEIPESLRDKATEVDGKFHVDANALTAKLNEILGEKKNRDTEIKRLKAEADKYRDLDPEKAREALQKIADAEAERLKTQGDWESRETALRQGFDAEKATWQTEKSERDTALDEFVIFSELARVSQLPEIKGIAELLKPLIAPFVRRKGLKDYEILDSAGQVRYGTDGNPLRMEALLKEMREHTVYSRLFDASGASGGGAPANTGGAGGAAAAAVAAAKNLKRSKMTDKEQAAYVRDYGYSEPKVKNVPAFKELPE